MSAALTGYQPAGAGFDEAIDAAGRPRPHWREVLTALAAAGRPGLAEAFVHAARLRDAEGAGHLVVDRDQRDRHEDAWRLDPTPFVLDHAEFGALARGVAQLVAVLERLAADVHGPRELVAAGVIPLGAVGASPRFRPAAAGAAGTGPRRWIVHAAIDVVRTEGGAWRLVRYEVEAPGGLGYALLNRGVTARVQGLLLPRTGPAPVHDHLAALRHALASAAPSGVASPRTVLLSGGPAQPGYVEHSYLAGRLGYHLVESGDVVSRDGRLWLRALDGFEPLDVVYRHIGDGGVDPLEAGEPGEAGARPGVPGLVWTQRRGGVSLANAYGVGVLEDPAVRASLPQVCSFLRGEALALAPLEPGPIGVGLANAPVFDGEGLAPRPVTLRLFAAADDAGVRVLQGGSGFVLAAGDDPAQPTARLVKDVWVVGGPSRKATVGSSAAGPPQVDFSRSVSRRAAEALFHLGRSAERAELSSRAARVVGDQLARDAGVVSLGGGGWARGVHGLLRAARGAPLDWRDALPLEANLRHELDDAVAAVAGFVAELVAEASHVREFLSTTTGRVLGRLADERDALAHGGAGVDHLDLLLVELAALAGLANESTVRGPAWRFADLGRRLQRALGVLGGVEATLGLAVEPVALQPLAEALLAANESLVAYRRRHRSDVEVHAALDLLVHDDTNPRALAFQLDLIREHGAALGWAHGAALADEAARAANAVVGERAAGGRRLDVDALVLACRAPLLALVDAVNARWFADPVNPVAVRGR
ncbi:MAG: circularly permuted type 2 ATP-grasp protein [Acidimicrobiales bacterium]